jgi:hypothetical protein
LKLAAFIAAKNSPVVDLEVNVQPPKWLRIFPNAASPLTAVLSGAFELPRDVPPAFRSLLKRMEHRRPVR